MATTGIALDDPHIRSALRSKLLRDHSNNRDTALMEELGLCRGRVRVDLAVVDAQMHGYEIKSDRDNLSRLDNQAEVYAKVFDRITLVVGDKHVERASDAVPAWWGILHVTRSTRGLTFRTARRAEKNPQRDPRSLVELLWRDDAIRLLEKGAVVRGVRSKPRRVVWDRVCDHFSIDEIAAAVRVKLKARAANQALA